MCASVRKGGGVEGRDKMLRSSGRGRRGMCTTESRGGDYKGTKRKRRDGWGQLRGAKGGRGGDLRHCTQSVVGDLAAAAGWGLGNVAFMRLGMDIA